MIDIKTTRSKMINRVFIFLYPYRNLAYWFFRKMYLRTRETSLIKQNEQIMLARIAVSNLLPMAKSIVNESYSY